MMFCGWLLAETSLAAGIPIGIPLGIPIGLAIGAGGAEKKLKEQVATAIAADKVRVLDDAGNPMSVDSLFELLKSKD